MAVFPQFLEDAAFGVLNDVIAGFRVHSGFAKPRLRHQG